MIEPLDSLVFSLYSRRGAYALLLGSGASRSAGIATGWEITLDLIRKLAASRGENCEPSPEDWYRDNVGDDLGYSALLGDLARTKEDRQQLLRAYFEPTDEEREEGKKIPAAAHKAIARLVADGHIKILITTNFDRLLEAALETVGVTPTVISSPAAAKGAIPLVHQECVVIKVNGDYLDTEIKNTEEELASYDVDMRGILEQVVNDFGLVICGWSGDWDAALYELLLSASNQRFNTYWATRGTPSERAKSLIAHRAGEVIQIQDADIFFSDLEERLSGLAEFDRPHPLSVAIATENVKKYLVDASHRIRLREMFRKEVERVFEEFSDPTNFGSNTEYNHADFRDRIERYDAKLELLTSMMIAGCYWGEKLHVDIWPRIIERLANTEQLRGGGYTHLIKLSLYPALRLLYAGGLAAVTGTRFQTLSSLLLVPQVRLNSPGDDGPVTGILNPIRVIDSDTLNRANEEKIYVPGSQHLHKSLREHLREYAPDDRDYDQLFDVFEFILAAVHAHEAEEEWLPLGRFGWRWRHGLAKVEELRGEIERQGDEHPLLLAGLFGSSAEKFQKSAEAVQEFTKKVRWF